jgi:YHS domain-containing protein
MTKTIVVFVSMLIFLSCKNTNQTKEPQTIIQEQNGMGAHKKALFKNVQFAANKDFVCGMPISAGVQDTAHYKGKIYGFCAAECKEEFLKNPESYLSEK